MERIQSWAKALLVMSFSLILTAFGTETRFGMTVDYGNDLARPKASNEESDYSHFLPKAPEQAPPRIEQQAPPQPQPQLMMSVANRSGNQMTTWNMCDRRAVIRAAKGHGSRERDVSCFDRRGNTTQQPERIHPTLVRYMEAYMLTCAQRAAQAAGYPQPVKLFLNISGAYAYRAIAGTNRMSQHAYGRALDIYDMSLFDAEGKRTWVDAHIRGYRGSNRTFYSTFKRCWDSKLGCDETNGSIGHEHAPGASNGAHNDHLHLQASPSCRGPRP